MPAIMFQIIETYGDIFAQCPSHIPLVHCVSLDMKMSKGIAKVFKHKFGNVPFLKAQVHSVGQVATLNYRGRFIFYMATKRHFSCKPTYVSLAKSLQTLKVSMERLGLTHLAMPRIATGLDNLQWPIVKELVTETFFDSNITIYVFYI